ncbi:MAG: redoxin domain-containing protein [Ignavibacteria bacterium]|nr:redoxin domain-containing protein [Ignavibacteria bacterium]
MKNILLIFILMIVSIFVVGTSFNSTQIPAAIENFTLLDYNGNEHSLSNYDDSLATVILFIATECPVSNDYNKRMQYIYNEYAPKGFAFLGINSNKAELVDRIKEHAEEKGLTFPVLKDEKNVIADMFEASVTPEAYILNSGLEILYQGRIDNSRNESEVVSKDLETALDEIYSGSVVTKKKTKAFGCTIKRI